MIRVLCAEKLALTFALRGSLTNDKINKINVLLSRNQAIYMSKPVIYSGCETNYV